MNITYWHITWGTYGTRLHGDDRPTVDRCHNQFGTPYLEPNPLRLEWERDLMVADPVELTDKQRLFIEDSISPVCERGGWKYVEAAARTNHVHVIVGADSALHGKDIRRWMKRWITQALNEKWECKVRPDGMSWWSECGSTKAIRDEAYYGNAVGYVRDQRTSACSGATRPGSQA